MKNKKKAERIAKLKLKLADGLFGIEEEMNPYTHLPDRYKIFFGDKVINNIIKDKIGCKITAEALIASPHILELLLKELFYQFERDISKKIFNNYIEPSSPIITDIQVPEDKIIIAMHPNTYVNNIYNLDEIEALIRALISCVSTKKNEKDKENEKERKSRKDM